MRYATLISAIVLFFSSCTNKSKNDITVFRATEEGLQQSIGVISQSNEIIYHSLKDRLLEPRSSIQAEIWEPKASIVKLLSDTLVTYIRQLKEGLKDEAGFSNSLDRESFNEDNIATVNHFFNEHEKGSELFNHLMNYKEHILAVDSQLNNVFKNNIVIFAKGGNYARYDSSAFTKSFFNDIPVIAACAMLSKLENNIRIIENNFINYCHSNTISYSCGYDVFRILIGQSSNCVKTGDNIEITAGVGSFSVASQPKISIDGKVITGDENGIVTHKFKTPSKAGNYSKIVKIEFYKPDGTKESMTKNIEYTVIDPNQNP
ncbi:MAG: hypothetical protein ABI685_00865 [Ferruginibacter sp.]